ncbi:MAG: hypothetical protein ABII10_02225 [Candidatus Paceibacterota bacterium]
MKYLLFLLSFALLFFPPIVLAQEIPNEQQDQLVQAEQAILQKQRFDTELVELNNIYRGQLSEYRLAEKEFTIARDQYHQLQTLASINEVNDAASKVMKLRNQVLITYLDLLRVNLIAAEGIELSLKELVLNRLEVQKNWLQTHQQAIANASDREQLNQLSDAFIAQALNLTDVSQQTVSLLSLGKLQNVFDRLTGIGQDLLIEEASQSGLAAERAVRETERLNQSLTDLLQTTWLSLKTDLEEQNTVDFYNKLSSNLNPIYADLNKLVSFLQERLRQL